MTLDARWRTQPLLIALALSLPIAVASCDQQAQSDVNDTGEARSRIERSDSRDLVDLRRGRFGRAGLGSSLAEARKAYPGRMRTGSNEPLAPLGIGLAEHLGPVTPRNPPDTRGNEGVWRFEEVALAAYSRRAWIVTISAERAHTRAGVGVGDSLDEIRSAYPRLRCDVANSGTEYVEYPYCTGKVTRRRHVWFGGDPVRTVTISVAPLE